MLIFINSDKWKNDLVFYDKKYCDELLAQWGGHLDKLIFKNYKTEYKMKTHENNMETARRQIVLYEEFIATYHPEQEVF